MRRPMRLWKQLLVMVAIVGVAAFGWGERDTIRGFFAASADESHAVGAKAKRAEGRGAGRRGEGNAQRRKEGRPAAQRQRTGQRRRQGRGRSGPAPVIVAKAALRRDDLALELVGTARAARSVELRMAASGQVVASGLEAAKRVSAGAQLLALESSAQDLAVDLAKTRLSAAEATLARLERLRQSGNALGTALDDAKTAAAVARIELAQAERAQADRKLIAPFSGVLSLPQVEIGDWVDQSKVVATLDDRATLLIEALVPETLLSRLDPGASVSVRTAARAGETYVGKVVSIDSRIDPASRAARVRVALANPNEALRPGGSFVLRFFFGGVKHPAAPELALQFGREGLFVWRIRDEKAEKVPVRLARRQEGLVLLESADAARALAPGDLIVVEGTQRMSEGQAVRLVGEPIELEQAQ